MLLILPLLARADIYQKTDVDDGTSFSDVDTQGAKNITLNPANIYSVNQAIEKTAMSNKSSELLGKNSYQKFSMIQPADQQTFQNQQEIVAALQIEPELRAGDNIEWWIDGELYQQNTNVELEITDLDRGEHTLQAKLLDAKNHILKVTQKVIFYVHYATNN